MTTWLCWTAASVVVGCGASKVTGSNIDGPGAGSSAAVRNAPLAIPSSRLASGGRRRESRSMISPELASATYPSISRSLVGEPVATARRRVERAGFSLRVVRSGVDSASLRADLQLARINVVVKNGKVKRVSGNY